MQPLLRWFNDRTGYRRLLLPIRRRMLPGGPSWWYATASCLLWLLVIEVVTGLLLMATYSPSTNHAWASVHFIEQSPGGAFIRGLHYYAAQAMIVLLGMHVIRVLLSAAFRAPHELVWISGLLLMPLLLLWGITGNPLSGTLDGMSQIEVEGNIIGSTPAVGPIARRILIGGDEPGHLTLTHLYSLHVGLLPAVAIVLLAVHISQIYRHGLSTSKGPLDGQRARPYWPYQTVRNMIALTAVVAVCAVLAATSGAPLGPPADSQIEHTPRPEWYFLFLFELRRYFSGDWEPVATVVLPVVALGLLVAMPFIDRRCGARLSQVLRFAIVGVLVFGIVGLSAMSMWRDRGDTALAHARQESRKLGQRARVLADAQLIGPDGAAALLRNDAKIQGAWLFKRHCASCHPHAGDQGERIDSESPSAPNLAGFGSARWNEGMLDADRIAGDDYFGKTKFSAGDMAGHVRGLFDAASDDAARATLRENLQLAALALEAEGRTGSASPTTTDTTAAAIAAGAALIKGDLGCVDCHKFQDAGDLGSAPDLTSYGSREWLSAMIADPNGARFYPDGRNDRMPAFAADPAHPDRNTLSPRELEMLVTWLRREWYEPSTSHVSGPSAPEERRAVNATPPQTSR